MESTSSAYSFFVKKLGENFLKENLEHLDFFHSWTYNPQKKLYICKYDKFLKIFYVTFIK